MANSTDAIRRSYIYSTSWDMLQEENHKNAEMRDTLSTQFDEWLEAHDAEIAAKAAKASSNTLPLFGSTPAPTFTAEGPDRDGDYRVNGTVVFNQDDSNLRRVERIVEARDTYLAHLALHNYLIAHPVKSEPERVATRALVENGWSEDDAADAVSSLVFAGVLRAPSRYLNPEG